MLKKILGYFGLVIFCFGFIGNILIIALLRRANSAKNITNCLVQLVAVADLFVISVCLFLDILSSWNVFDVTEAHPIGCKIFKFTEYSSMDIAVWLMIVFSVERYFYVCFPLKSRILCRVLNIQISVSLVLFLVILKNVHVFWTRGLEGSEKVEVFSNSSDEFMNTTQYVLPNETKHLTSNCDYTSVSNKKFHLFYRPWIVVVFSNILPMVLLIFCNGAIIKKLICHKKKWENSNLTRNTNNKGNSSSQSVTIMCLVISIAFIIFTVPTMVLLVGKPYWTKTIVAQERYKAAKTINNYLYFINHSINFYLYLITVKSFRSEAKRFICCQSLPDRTSYTSKPAVKSFKAGCYSRSDQTSIIYGYNKSPQGML